MTMSLWFTGLASIVFFSLLFERLLDREYINFHVTTIHLFIGGRIATTPHSQCTVLYIAPRTAIRHRFLCFTVNLLAYGGLLATRQKHSTACVHSLLAHDPTDYFDDCQFDRLSVYAFIFCGMDFLESSATGPCFEFVLCDIQTRSRLSQIPIIPNDGAVYVAKQGQIVEETKR